MCDSKCKDVLVSVVIANYNYGRFLNDAITSVLSQEQAHRCEVIVVDGGSSDESLDVIKRHADDIAWWCSEKDKGQSDAFNKGFRHASGKFGCWLNADDLMMPGTIKRVVDYVERYPETEWLSGSCMFSDADLRIWRCSRCPRVYSWFGKLMPAAPVNGPSSFFRIDNLRRLGGFDISAHYTMDIDLWRKFFANGIKLHQVKDYFWCFRCHEQSKTSSQRTTGVHVGEPDAEADRINLRYGISRRTRKLSEKLDRFLRLVTGMYLWSYIDTKRYKGVDARELLRR